LQNSINQKLSTHSHPPQPLHCRHGRSMEIWRPRKCHRRSTAAAGCTPPVREHHKQSEHILCRLSAAVKLHAMNRQPKTLLIAVARVHCWVKTVQWNLYIQVQEFNYLQLQSELYMYVQAHLKQFKQLTAHRSMPTFMLASLSVRRTSSMSAIPCKGNRGNNP